MLRFSLFYANINQFTVTLPSSSENLKLNFLAKLLERQEVLENLVDMAECFLHLTIEEVYLRRISLIASARRHFQIEGNKC